MDHIIALAKPYNVASRKVMEKLGLKYKKDIKLFNMDCVYYDIWYERNKN